VSIQAQFNQECIDMLPIIKQKIAVAKSFDANQMFCKTLREAGNSSKPICEMNDNELMLFQLELIRIFKHCEWIE